MDDFTASRFISKSMTINQDVRNVCNLKTLIVVLVALVFKMDKDQVRVLDENIAT